MLFLVLHLKRTCHFPPKSTVTFWTSTCVHTVHLGEITRGHTKRRTIVVRLPPGMDNMHIWRGILINAPRSTQGRDYTVRTRPVAFLLDAHEAEFPSCADLTSSAGTPSDYHITRLGCGPVERKTFSMLTAPQKHLLKREADRVWHDDDPDPPPRQPFPPWNSSEEDPVIFPPCCICFEKIVEPWALSCGHVFCANCVESARTNERCAKCRTGVVGPSLRLFF